MKYFLLLFLCIAISAQAQWERVPTLNAGTSGLMLDEQNYLVMGFGQGYYSEDAGKSWKEAFMNESQRFYFSKLHKISPTVLVASTYDYHNSRLLKTSNAGKNWQYIQFFPNRKILDVQFVSVDTGYLALNNPYRFLKTIDGGLHWDSLPLPENPVSPNIDYANVQFRFWNGQLGYLGVSPGNQTTRLFKTTNGGQTWISTSTIGGTGIGKIASIQLLDADRVLYCFWSISSGDHAKWYFSSQGGLSPKKVLESLSAPFGFEMGSLFKSAPGHFHFKTYWYYYNDDESGLSSREGFQTTNNGTTWTQKPGIWVFNMNTEPNPNLNASYHLEVGYGNRVFKADQTSPYRTRISEGGVGTVQINPNGEIYIPSKIAVSYLDSAFRVKELQWLLGPDYSTNMGANGYGSIVFLGKRSFLATYYSNLASSWTAATFNVPDSLGEMGPRALFFTPYKFCFAPDSNLVVTTNDTFIRLHKVSDFSFIQRSIPAGLPRLMEPVFFSNSTSVYYLANQSRIYKTTDSAATWQETAYDTANGPIKQLHFQNANLGFAFGRHICRTSDGGQSWSMVDTTQYPPGNWKVHFITPSKGFAYGPKLLKTTDSGLTWLPVPIPVSQSGNYPIMVFNSTGEGFVNSYLDSVFWYYHPDTDVWTSEPKPKNLGSQTPVFDFVHHRWLVSYWDYVRSGVYVRTGGPVVPKAKLQLAQDRLCLGDSIEVNFLFSDLQMLTPVQVQLSDGQGSFINSTLLGNLNVARSQNESVLKRRFAMPTDLSLGGNYRVRVSGNFSFQSSSGQQFTLRPVPVVQVAASDTLCMFSTQSMLGSPSGGLWTSNALYLNGTLKAETQAGTYSSVYTVAVSPTCSASDTLLLTVLPSPPPAVISLSGNTLQSDVTPGFVFRWIKDGAPVGLPGDTSLVLSGAGAYWLEAQNALGCSSQSNVVLITNLQLSQEGTRLRIYPNPAHGFFLVQSPFPARAVLMNEMGRKLAEFNLASGQDVSINTQGFPGGVYFLKVVSRSRSEVHKVLVMKE